MQAQSELQVALKDLDIAPHWIYDDLPKALAEAKATSKPLFIVLRCVPCPPGKTLDGQVMMPDADLEKLEKAFVCVRIVQTKGLDLQLFQYDYDQSWAAMFLTPDRTIIGRYGTRAGNGPRSETHISLPSLRKAMERALALYQNYPANKEKLMGKLAKSADYRAPEVIPGLEARAAGPTMPKTCIHCHMVRENIIRAKWNEKRLTAADLYVYPLPELIGLTLDINDGLLVKSVDGSSAAAKAGLVAGDQLLTFNGQPLISIADIQWVLQQAPEQARLPVTLRRAGQDRELFVELSGNWKAGDISWRASSWGLRHGLKVSPLSPAEKQKRAIPAESLALLVNELFNPGSATLTKAGLRRNDVILAIDGKKAPLTESQFLVSLRLNYGPADKVRLTVLRGEAQQELTIPMW